MSGASHDIPPGYVRISGKRNPPDHGQRYWVAFRNGMVETQQSYPVAGTRWVWGDEPHPFDIVAVKEA